MVSTNVYPTIKKEKSDLGNNLTWRSLWSTVSCYIFIFLPFCCVNNTKNILSYVVLSQFLFKGVFVRLHTIECDFQNFYLNFMLKNVFKYFYRKVDYFYQTIIKLKCSCVNTQSSI